MKVGYFKHKTEDVRRQSPKQFSFQCWRCFPLECIKLLPDHPLHTRLRKCAKCTVGETSREVEGPLQGTKQKPLRSGMRSKGMQKGKRRRLDRESSDTPLWKIIFLSGVTTITSPKQSPIQPSSHLFSNVRTPSRVLPATRANLLHSFQRRTVRSTTFSTALTASALYIPDTSIPRYAPRLPWCG